jgi:hypothetical protein
VLRGCLLTCVQLVAEAWVVAGCALIRAWIAGLPALAKTKGGAPLSEHSPRTDSVEWVMSRHRLSPRRRDRRGLNASAVTPLSVDTATDDIRKDTQRDKAGIDNAILEGARSRGKRECVRDTTASQLSGAYCTGVRVDIQALLGNALDLHAERSGPSRRWVETAECQGEEQRWCKNAARHYASSTDSKISKNPMQRVELRSPPLGQCRGALAYPPPRIQILAQSSENAAAEAAASPEHGGGADHECPTGVGDQDKIQKDVSSSLSRVTKRR